MKKLLNGYDLEEPFREEIFSSDRFERYGIYLAKELKIKDPGKKSKKLLPRVSDNARLLDKIYQEFIKSLEQKKILPEAADWLVDNFHIIEDQIREIKEDLPRKYYKELPKLEGGRLDGYPRVYSIAIALIAHSDSQLDINTIKKFTRAFQSVTPLSIGELWALAIHLRIALIENMRRVALHVLAVEERKSRVDEIVDRIFDGDKSAGKELNDMVQVLKCESLLGCATVAQISKRLRDQSEEVSDILKKLEEKIKRRGVTSEDVIRMDHQHQAETLVTIRNIVTSLRLLFNIDWQDFFESICLLEPILGQDPAVAYKNMDFSSRDRYRHAIERISKNTGVDQIKIARETLRLADRSYHKDESDIRKRHVGYYLIGDGVSAIEEKFDYRPDFFERIKKIVTSRPANSYFLLLLFQILVILFPIFIYLNILHTSIVQAMLVLGVLLIPASDIALNIHNLIFTTLLKPHILPKLDFSNGIPAQATSFVVVPTLFTTREVVEELLERLEVNYLSNQQENLYFSLLGDLADADSESLPTDAKLLEVAKAGIEKLNQRYASPEKPRFFVFYRKRLWNPSEGKWMGWERKRGKIHEFNRLIRGDENTSFIDYEFHKELFCRVRYVITLDSDTKMPKDTARKLIGAIHHPYNRPQFNEKKGLVDKGYGILQPRVSITPESSSRTLFAKIFSGHTGIDPYTTAVSNVYQDLFQEGIYTGKGIYEIDAFEKSLASRVPENLVLSHDLFEGLFARTALVTDIEFLDDYPCHYDAFARRQHRWTRGDWQILSWLFPRVPAGDGKKRQNDLSAIARWKIFDNLRRSLVAPSTLLWFVCGWIFFPGSPFVWTFIATSILLLPPYLHATNSVLFHPKGVPWTSHFWNIWGDFRDNTVQIILAIIFLPHQAYIQIDAIVRTLYRVNFSKQNMLQWTTAAQMENAVLSNSRVAHNIIWPVEIFVVLLISALVLFKEGIVVIELPFIAAWIFFPIIVHQISMEITDKMEELEDHQIESLRLICRRTWLFFERFVTKEDNWLPPDNYQLDPSPVIAHRTSPTNMGMYLLSAVSAYDLGHLFGNDLLNMFEKSLDSMEKLKKFKGHFYNWYDTQTLMPLNPPYVSSVDSGNLAGHLITAKNAFLDIVEQPLLRYHNIEALWDNMTLALQESKRISPKYSETETISMAELESEIQKCLYDFENDFPSDNSEWSSFAGAVLSRLVKVGEILQELEQKHGIEVYEDLRTWLDSSFYMVNRMKDENELLVIAPIEVCEDLKNELEETAPDFLRDILEIFNPSDEVPSLRSLEQSYRYALVRIKGIRKRIDGELAENQHLSSELLKVLQKAEESFEQKYLSVKDQLDRFRSASSRCDEMASSMDFASLYDKEKKVFCIGYNTDEGRRDNAYYDLLASEARLLSFYAIAKGDVPQAHWFHLGRQMTSFQGRRILISWTASMFEYLMPMLVMKTHRNTLLRETHDNAVRCQIAYAKNLGIPWGISESGYNGRNIHLDYQYGPFGIPGIALKYGLSSERVVSPYSTALAAMVTPIQSLENFKRLEDEGALTKFGFFEAIDYTKERIQPKTDKAIVKSYMAHHQGMTLVALNNVLNNNIMQLRFHDDPIVRSTDMILQERIPSKVKLAKHRVEKIISAKVLKEQEGDFVRTFDTPFTPYPEVHVLSNGNYSVVVSAAGSGHSKCNGLLVNRWEEDPTMDDQGSFIYLRDLGSGFTWSSTYQPTKTEPTSYQCTFFEHKAEFWRRDSDIITHTEIVVSAEDDVELRMLTLSNASSQKREIELTSFLEPVFGDYSEYTAHPAFSKLFLQTEYVEERNALLVHRRKRSEEDSDVWGIHKIINLVNPLSDIEFETDRMRFIGRGHSPSNPIVYSGHTKLSNTQGMVLDPVLSLRTRVEVKPGASVQICFVTGLTQSRDKGLQLIEKYSDINVFGRENEMAWTQGQVSLRHLNITKDEAHLYQRLVSFLLYPRKDGRPNVHLFSDNKLSQKGLWAQGISGDIPIVLLRIDTERDMKFVRQMIHAHEYLRLKNIEMDLVILNEEKTSYRMDLHDDLMKQIYITNSSAVLNKKAGIFLLQSDQLSDAEKSLLYASSRLYMHAQRGALSDQLRRTKTRPFVFKTSKFAGEKTPYPYPPMNITVPELEYFNDMGGFSKDGKEYVIVLKKNHRPPLPWINVVANKRGFGFLLTESGSMSTWAGNARENRITPWFNDPVSDPSGEIIYLRDEQTGEVWGPTSGPAGKSEKYVIQHGLGYTKIKSGYRGIQNEMLCFVPHSDHDIKILKLKLKNTAGHSRKISTYFYIEWVLGYHRNITAPHIVTEQEDDHRLIMAHNVFNEEFGERISFCAVNSEVYSFTCDRRDFLGRNGSYEHPAGTKSQFLKHRSGATYDPCAAMQSILELAPGQEIELVFLLGQAADKEQARRLKDFYTDKANIDEAFNHVREFWDSICNTIQVKTPERELDIMLNSWLLYQTLSCRIWGRSGLYQSGGAYGFRDQLQDVMCLVHTNPKIAREHILLCARHQFEEGDVQHWWHPPGGKGVRTHFSDDLLWLPFVVSHYISKTGDVAVLDEEVPYLRGPLLGRDEEDNYFLPETTPYTESLYSHCIKSIDRSLPTGKHNLPLMGTGDWNDGMNRVGHKGEGESVWLGWFLITILKSFLPYCQKSGDSQHYETFKNHIAFLTKAIEGNAWDGQWYIRAFFDDGTPLGSRQSEECQIDSLSQTWSVLSGAGMPERQKTAMQSVEDALVRDNEEQVVLFTPPFDKTELDPGYIKGYLPGVRENGGQYTHAATWVAMAFAQLGDGDKAHKVISYLNPINHTSSLLELQRYKGEPYVTSADVYAIRPHVGRAGWTWYTGSAGWLYRAGMESLLGIHLLGERLKLVPCIPKHWPSFEVKISKGDSLYTVLVRNPDGLNTSQVKIVFDGKYCEGDEVLLKDDGQEHRIEATMLAHEYQPSTVV